ncbi:hypothetical protein V1477_017829 [Vespula maculifrons]|uniref:Ribosomal protein S3 n=1 Tax=Vespula maculifrons TaxID=7453 RepID=A0ABD2AZX2_VESMC
MEKKHFSLTIFFSETIAPRRTGVGSLERARHALYAHIFFVQIGPIGAETQENRSGVIGKDSSRPLRPYFFLPDWTNRSRVITKNLNGVIGKDSSRPLRPYFLLPDRTNRSRVITEPSYNGLKGTKEKNIVFNNFFLRNCSTQENLTGVIGKDSSRPLRPYFFRPDLTNRSRVIKRLGEPDRGHWKGFVAPSQRRTGLGSLERNRRALYAHIFFVQIGPIGADTQENRSWVIGKGSSRPVRTYFFRPDRTNRSQVITEPSYNGLKVTKEKKHFSLTIFFSETIAPRRTGPGSLERTRRALYAHIFFFQIGPIGADTQENRCGVIGKGSSRPVRPYFFRPDRINRSRVITENLTGVIGKGSSRPVRPYFFRPDRINRSRVITENLTGVIGKGSSRPLRPYFFRPDRTNRSRVITHRREPDRGHSKGLVAPSAPIFFHPNRTNRSRVITHPGEPDQGHWKGPVASSTPIGPIGAKVQRRKTLYLTIFFSETVAPRRTCPGSLERARRALYAHIFFVQIGPIGADTQKNRSGVIGKGSSRPLRPYFFRPDRTNRSRVITKNLNGVFGKGSPRPEPSYNGLKGTKEKNIVFNNFFLRNCSTQENLTGVIGKDSSRTLRPYFFRPDRTNRSRVITENRSWVIGKGSSRPVRTYFFRPDRTNRSQVITHLGEPDRGHWKGLVAPSTPKNLNGVIGKDSSRPLRPYFFLPDRTNRSRVITHSGEPVWGHWKGLVGPCTHIFFSSRSDQQEPSYNGLKGTKEKNIHLGEPDRGHGKGLVAPSTHIFFSSRSDQ